MRGSGWLLFVLASSVSLGGSRAQDDCGGFPFAGHPAWRRVGAFIPESGLQLMEGSTLYKGELFLRNQDGSKRLKDFFKSEMPKFFACWPVGFVNITLSEKGRNPLKNENLYWKFRFSNGQGFEFSNLTRCTTYQVQAELFLGTPPGQSRGVIFSGYTTIPPKGDVPPVVETKPGFFGARVTVRSKDPHCLNRVERAFVNCQQDGVYRNDRIFAYPTDTVTLDYLFPGLSYRCKAWVRYTIGGIVSSAEEFQFTTLEPSLFLHSHPKRFDVTVDNSVVQYEEAIGKVEIEDEGETREIGLDEAVVKGVEGLVPFTTYKVCLVVETKIGCNFADCRSPYRACETKKTDAVTPEAEIVAEVQKVGSASFIAIWEEPKEMYGRFVTYTYRLEDAEDCGADNGSPDGCQCEEATDVEKYVSETSLMIDKDLRPYHGYSLRVRLENHVGAGPWGPAADFFTLPAAPPLSKEDFKLEPGQYSVSITMDAPCPYTGPLEVTYQLKLKRNGRVLRTEHSRYDIESPDSSEKKMGKVLMDGLTPDEGYEVCVYLKAAEGSRGLACEANCEVRDSIGNFEVQYVAFIRKLFLDFQMQKNVCKYFETLEAPPADPPKLEMTYRDSSSFKIR